MSGRTDGSQERALENTDEEANIEGNVKLEGKAKEGGGQEGVLSIDGAGRQPERDKENLASSTMSHFMTS